MDSQWRSKQLRFLSLAIICLGLTVSFQNCSGKKSSSSDSSAGLSTQEVLNANAQAILKGSCFSCHNPDNPQGTISDITSLDELLYKRLVVPGEPQLSILFLDIQAGTMPPSGPLNADQIQMLSDWIVGLKASGGTVGSGTPLVLGPNFNAINTFIIKPKCLGCHNSTNAAKGVSFSTYQQVMTQITPGLPASSLFYTVTSGGTMPPAGALTAAELNAIRDWIMAGALNN